MYETVNDLYERLRELIEDDFGDAKLRIAYQPDWPLAALVEAVTVFEQSVDADDEGEELPVIWLAASNAVPYHENPYAPREVWLEQ